MKKLLLFLILALVLIGCVSSNNTTNRNMCPVLDSIMNIFTNKCKDDKIFHIKFYRINHSDIISISNAYAYDKNFVDGYFFYKDRLVTYCFFDNREREDIIYTENCLDFTDTITGYSEKSTIVADFEPYNEKYLLRSTTEIKPLEPQYIQKNWELATDTNVINNTSLNCLLNDYINKNPSVLYDLRFNYIGKNYYVSITGREYYDSNNSGYFIRNGHLVVIYSLENIQNTNLLQVDELRNDNRNLLNYRKAQIELWTMPYTQKYQFFKGDSIKQIPNDINAWGI